MSRELDPIDAVLRHAREGASPSADDLARAFSGIGERIALGPSHPSGAWQDAAGGSGRRTTRWAGSLRRLLGTTLVLGVGFTIGVQYERRRLDVVPASPDTPRATLSAAPPAVISTTAQSQAANQDPTVPGAVAVPATGGLGSSSAATSAPLRASTARKPVARAATARVAPSAAPVAVPAGELQPLSFADVLERVEQAQRAERDGEPERSLQLLDELDRRADAATLREERLVTRVLAACDVGDAAAAERALLALGDTNPTSVYRSRVAQSCVAVAPSAPPAAIHR